MIFLSVQAVEEMHRGLIERTGGSSGLRDRGLLESAVNRAENKTNYEPHASAAEVAASLAWGLIENHAFLDGNKRIGLAVLIVLLRLNGWRLTCSEEEETGVVLRAAAGEISEAEWTAWVVSRAAPVEAG